MVEKNPASIACARGNLEKFGFFARARIVESETPEDVPPCNVSLVVSNPPYIPSAVIDGLMPEVSRWEPRLRSTAAKTAWLLTPACLRWHLACFATAGTSASSTAETSRQLLCAPLRRRLFTKRNFCAILPVMTACSAGNFRGIDGNKNA
jgi:tRNA1(Val) A37 N6-methylase TrmN6